MSVSFSCVGLGVSCEALRIDPKPQGRALAHEPTPSAGIQRFAGKGSESLRVVWGNRGGRFDQVGSSCLLDACLVFFVLPEVRMAAAAMAAGDLERCILQTNMLDVSTFWTCFGVWGLK